MGILVAINFWYKKHDINIHLILTSTWEVILDLLLDSWSKRNKTLLIQNGHFLPVSSFLKWLRSLASSNHYIYKSRFILKYLLASVLFLILLLIRFICKSQGWVVTTLVNRAAWPGAKRGGTELCPATAPNVHQNFYVAPWVSPRDGWTFK